jgi:hypothetical protein
MTSQHGAYALRAGSARLYERMRMRTPTLPGTQCTHVGQGCTHTNMYNLLLFHSNNCFVNAPQCNVIRTLPVLSFFISLAQQYISDLGRLIVEVYRSHALRHVGSVGLL